jgi:hypothetical protein
MGLKGGREFEGHVVDVDVVERKGKRQTTQRGVFVIDEE